MGLRDTFSGAAKKRFAREPADLPEDWDGREQIFVRKLSAAERDGYEASNSKFTSGPRGGLTREANLVGVRARLIVRCLCDGEGKRIYSDADAAQLGDDLPGDVADALYEQCAALNGIGEDAKKNSPTANGSTAGSPSPSGNQT